MLFIALYDLLNDEYLQWKLWILIDILYPVIFK